MTEQPHVLQARHLAYSYRPGEPILRDVSFTAAAGELVCLLGPNGSGKSTLLRCLLGLLKPAAGEVLLDGKKLADYSPRGLARMLGYVPQFPRSAFEFTVEQIVLMGRLAHLGVLGLAGKADRSVHAAPIFSPRDINGKIWICRIFDLVECNIYQIQ